jgi:PAS domain S-box-containing protein
MMNRSCGLPGRVSNPCRHSQQACQSAVRLALLIVALCMCSLLHAADAMEVWRNEVARVRIMADNNAPAAYQEAKRLQARLSSDASPVDQARILNLLSRIEIYMALTAPATRNAERALELARQHADRVGQAEANLNIALNAIVESRTDAMSAAPAASIELLEGVDRPELLGEALLRMAMMYHRRGQLDEAISMSTQAMEIARRSNHPLSLVYAHQGLGIALDQSENHKEAQAHFVRMRDLARVANSKILEAYAMLGMATTASKLGDPQAGETLIREAIGLFRIIGAPFALNHALFTLGDNMRSRGRHADALSLFNEVVATYERHPNKIGLWWSLGARGGEHTALGNRVAALADAERAYAVAKEIGLTKYLAESAQQIAALHALKGDFRRAYEMSTEAAVLLKRTEREKMSRRVLELSQLYESESKRRQIDELTRRNEQQQAELRQRELQQRLLWTVLGGSVAILAGTIFFLVRLRRSHSIIGELNTSLEHRVQSRTAELRQQTRYLRTLIDALPWWVWLKDTESRYLAVNQAAADAYSLRTDELVGKSDLDILPRESAEAFRADDLEVMISRSSKILEESQKLSNGTIWMETFKAPVLDEDGTVLGTVGFARDISERKAIEAAREAALAEAQQLAQLRSDFLAQISHELRTPLNGILGYAQILRRDKSMDERQLAGLHVIQQSGEHLLTLINDILDSAKIEAGKLELYPSAIPVAPFLRVIADMITVKAEEKGLEFVSDIAPDLPATIHADEKRLRQVLLNLLANAIKFTDHGRVTLRIHFSPPNRLRFEVQDTGIGIAAEQMPEVFQPFAQSGEVQRRLGGTGLGLVISRQFVRLMGGDIQVESNVGAGSRFTFDLELPVMHSEMVAGAEVETNVIGYEGARKAILVVDDIAENRAVAIEMLRQIGFTMHEASNGVEALEKAQMLQPDLILMDVVMPEMDGLEATRRLRQFPLLAHMPIIAVSASASDEDKKHYLAMKVNAFLAKPLVLRDLLQQVGSLLQLTWILEVNQTIAANEMEPAAPLEVPPRAEMELLHHLARIGNMNDIAQHAIYLGELDERYRPFAIHLTMLAKSYQSKAILKFVQEHLSTRAE